MTLRARLFTKDARRASHDLAANLQYAISKVCRDKPVKLSQLKVDYDRFFKDKIATKNLDAVTAALKAIEEHVITVKVYIQDGNREMTDSLVGLRSASYAADMCNEDSPQVSKERLLQIIRDQASNGIYVRDIEERYVSVYGNRPSYLPYKSLKGLLHRTAEVELASSGKNLRVRIRQQSQLSATAQSGPSNNVVQRRPMTSQIPALNRSSFVGAPSSLSQSMRTRRPREIMSMSMFRPSGRSSRNESRSEMTRSVFIPSSSSSESSTPSISSSNSGSPNGSIDMSVSMIMPPTTTTSSSDIGRISQNGHTHKANTDDINKHNKDIMAAILNGLPPEGLPLKGLIDEFVAISGQAVPLNMTAVDFLKKDFSEVVKIADDPEGLRVYRVNSPLCPRRTLADVYTRIALHSNRKPSDRVLKVLKDIYKNRESSPGSLSSAESTNDLQVRPIVHVASNKITPLLEKPTVKTSVTGGPSGHEQKRDIHNDEEKHGDNVGVPQVEKEFSPRERPRLNSSTQRGRDEIITELKSHLSQRPVQYPEEFEQIVAGSAADNQSLLMELMSSLNLCLKPSEGRMVLIAN